MRYRFTFRDKDTILLIPDNKGVLLPAGPFLADYIILTRCTHAAVSWIWHVPEYTKKMFRYKLDYDYLLERDTIYCKANRRTYRVYITLGSVPYKDGHRGYDTIVLRDLTSNQYFQGSCFYARLRN